MRRESAAHAISARSVVNLLAARHTRDLFFEEVKDGPTIFGNHLRLDALAIRKSWSPIRLMGYEVKVTRADWLSDRKWEAYLPLAHQFSIAAPAGIVQLEELPVSVGLFEVSSTGATLRAVRKPVYREIELPGELLVYLLMTRTRPVEEHYSGAKTRDERIAEWRQRLASGRDIAYAVSEKLRERIRNAERSAGRTQELADVDAWLERLGASRWGSMTERLDSAVNKHPEKFLAAADALNKAAIRAAELLREFQEVHDADPS